MLGITDSNGTLVAEYRYDAYGKPVKILDGNGNDVSTNYAHIANINPIRYRGYYYDIETGFYYLNSRYYDPEIGRFINADGYVSTGNGVLENNMFAYCLNNPVNQVDPLGTASYQNSYTEHKDNNGNILGYNITTVVNVMYTKLTYKYYIKANGVIQFDFDKNNYWSLLWRLSGKILAEAMYKQAKSINKEFLSGRTIGGINTELQGHWAAYQITRSSRAGVADIGALMKGKNGYDSNAWIWECGNSWRTINRVRIFGVKGFYSPMRDLKRYIR